MFKIPREKCSSAPKKNPTKKAFTLAEVMIVLTIIGILSAILLPSAIHSTPDKNILKFKKAHNTLHTAIRELINSEEYYTSGNFAYTPSGVCVGGQSWAPCDPNADDDYFCSSFADIVEAKSVSCKNKTISGLSNMKTKRMTDDYLKTDSNYEAFKLALEAHCSNDWSSSDERNYFVLNDGVVFDTAYEFAWAFMALSEDTFSDKNGFSLAYGVMCLDIDGQGGVKPFAYAVRNDGKIVSGARADWWLPRDITKKETNCCPKDLNDNGLCDEGDTVCE